MYDPRAPTSMRVLRLLQDPPTRPRLVRLAETITRSWADAEDLVSDAINRVLDPDDSPWDKRPFMTHMAYVMKHTWTRQQRVAQLQREAADEDVTRGTKGTSHNPPADEQLEGHRALAVLRRLGERLLEGTGVKHPLCSKYFELTILGVEPAKQAETLGCTVDELYDAHQTLRRHAGSIREKWEDAEQERMKKLRSKFRPPDGPPEGPKGRKPS